MSDPSGLHGVQHHARRRRESGDLAGARAMLADALDAAKPAYGEGHPDVLSTAHLLARMHREAAEPAAARRVLEEALAAGQRQFGDSDPLLLAISFDLGWVAEELGNRHEARRNFGRVASAGPAVLGQDHWAVRAAREYLGEEAPAEAGTAAQSGVPANGQPVSDYPASVAPAPAEPARDLQPARSRTPARTDGMGPRLPAHPAAAPGPLAWDAAERELPAPRAPEPARTSVSSPRRGRGGTIVAVVAACAATVAAGLAAVAVLRGDDVEGPGPSVGQSTGTVALTGEPPTDVRVARQGDTLVVTWRDPTSGRVSFVVTGAPPGATLRLLGQVPPGTTRFPLNGANAGAGYCFRVAAVYSTDEIGVSKVVCTDATAPTPG